MDLEGKGLNGMLYLGMDDGYVGNVVAVRPSAADEHFIDARWWIQGVERAKGLDS